MKLWNPGRVIPTNTQEQPLTAEEARELSRANIESEIVLKQRQMQEEFTCTTDLIGRVARSSSVPQVYARIYYDETVKKLRGLGYKVEPISSGESAYRISWGEPTTNE